MIEIEKKFQLKPGDEERLLEGARFKKEVVNNDVYWDTAVYVMTGKDWWLRQRNGAWELKVARHKPGSSVDQYDELETEPEIRAAIGLVEHGTLEEDLRAAGYAPFCTIVTTRRKYELGEFHIDMDRPDFDFAVCEIETMVSSDAEMDAAAERVMSFATSRGLSTANVRGKILEYLFRFRPEHYQELVRRGVARA